MLLAATSVGTLALLGVADGSANSSTNGVQVTPTTIEATPADVPAPEPTTTPTPTTTATTTTAPSEPIDDSVPDDTTVTDTTLLGDDGTDVPGSADADGTTQISIRVEPTIRSTDIAPATIVLAIGVLLAVVVAWRIAVRRAARAPHAAAPAPAVEPISERAPHADATTLAFLLDLGEALVDAGDAVHNVTGTLQGVARVNGTEGLGAIVLPTALILSVPGSGPETTKVSTAGTSRLRLDQIESLMSVVDRAERGELSPADGRRELSEIRARPHPSSTTVQLVGSATAAAGLAMVLRGGAPEVLLAGVLGTLVGLLNVVTMSARFLYRPFWPLLASFVTAAATFAALRLADIVVFPALVAPLITFLPGALLTIAVLELATGQLLAGSSRLAAGGFQLVLLALGIVAGAQLVGVPASAVGSAPEGPVAVAGPWVGVAVFGVGIVWMHGLRAVSIAPILVVLYVAYAGQVVGGAFVGSALSAFFGAVAMTPVAVLLARQGLGPPTLVSFFPGFWILVPGALGLEGVTRIIGNDGFVATGTLTTTATSMIGIALGVLLGLAISTPDPERPWLSGTHRRRWPSRPS